MISRCLLCLFCSNGRARRLYIFPIAHERKLYQQRHQNIIFQTRPSYNDQTKPSWILQTTAPENSDTLDLLLTSSMVPGIRGLRIADLTLTNPLQSLDVQCNH